ncbi:MAG: D-alanyl-D-alanine carboxypeptidase [Lachnospiraceae bacterium]|nr:D-alanyl-D-alanine carboxypeptidase [Lachnospiraceae bacterium]
MYYRLMKKYGLFSGVMCAILFAGSIFNNSITAYADSAEDRVLAHKEITVESNAISDWPQGPIIGAESAILLEANTGTVLYEKNIHAKEYPASTTKILTTLIATEMCSLDEIVTFEHDDIFGIPRDSNNIALDVGESLTVEECLNAILIRSANEVCYGLARHISGSWDEFADLMNKRAKELGCTDSNFANPNGLPDENHYTSAHDLAMIGKAFFANQMLCDITLSPMLVIHSSDRQPDEIMDANKMSIIPGGSYSYDHLVGVKTGYTDISRYSIVSCAEHDGLKLICVILNDETPNQYEDTISLFNYGFSNFEKIYIADTDSKYIIDSGKTFYSGNDIFGSSKDILSMDPKAFIILPAGVSPDRITESIFYESEDPNVAAVIKYSYNSTTVGEIPVLFSSEDASYSFDPKNSELPETEDDVIYVNVVKILIYTGIGVAAIVLVILLIKLIQSYQFSTKNNRRNWRRDKLFKRRSRGPAPTSSRLSQKNSTRRARKRSRSYKGNNKDLRF